MPLDADIPETDTVAVTVNEPLAPDPDPVSEGPNDPGFHHAGDALERIVATLGRIDLKLGIILAQVAGDDLGADPLLDA